MTNTTFLGVRASSSIPRTPADVPRVPGPRSPPPRTFQGFPGTLAETSRERPKDVPCSPSPRPGIPRSPSPLILTRPPAAHTHTHTHKNPPRSRFQLPRVKITDCNLQGPDSNSQGGQIETKRQADPRRANTQTASSNKFKRLASSHRVSPPRATRQSELGVNFVLLHRQMRGLRP